jgi:hypothetical protein
MGRVDAKWRERALVLSHMTLNVTSVWELRVRVGVTPNVEKNQKH